MNNNKVVGSNRNKTMKKQKLIEKITPIDDDGYLVLFCSNLPAIILWSHFFYVSLCIIDGKINNKNRPINL